MGFGVAAEPNGLRLIEEGSLLDPRRCRSRERGLQCRHGGTSYCSRWNCDLLSGGGEYDDHHCDLAHCVRGPCGRSTSSVFPGDSEIGLDLTTVVLVNGTWIFIFLSCTIAGENVPSWVQPDALPLSSAGHVAWATPADINVCDRYLKESLEDFLITHFGSLNGVRNNDALCLN